MHIHKPKAARTLGEFLAEIGIIVIGIMIALSGEQGIEWLHWRHLVHRTQETLADELAHDMGVLKFRQSQSACIDDRVKDLRRYRDSWRTGHPLRLARPITGPFLYVFTDDAWSVAQTGQTAAHMPMETQLHYQHIYRIFRFLDERRLAEGAIWDDLSQFDGARHLDEHDLIRLNGMLSNALAQNAFYEFNDSPIKEIAAELHVKPLELKGNPEIVKQLCAPLIAPSPRADLDPQGRRL